MDNKNIDIKELQELLCSYLGISMEGLIGRKTPKGGCIKRHISIYFASIFTDLKTKQIANAFGRKDHTVTLNSIKKIRRLKREFPHFNNKISEVTKELRKLIDAPEYFKQVGYFEKNRWTDMSLNLDKNDY